MSRIIATGVATVASVLLCWISCTVGRYTTSTYTLCKGIAACGASRAGGLFWDWKFTLSQEVHLKFFPMISYSFSHCPSRIKTFLVRSADM